MKRNFGIDLLRSLAVIFVILVHVFLNTNYYSSNQVGLSCFIFTCIRNIAFTCVPLFIILTGYCMSSKTVNKDYFKGIKKILIVYILISFITILYRIFYLGETFNIQNHIIGIFKFTTNKYSWYIDMYFGLYLLIPFLNTLYKGIEEQNKKYLYIVLLILCVIPSTFSNINIENYNMNIFPTWWNNLYPLLYYFIGVNIKEKQYSIKKIIPFITIILSIIVQSIIDYKTSSGGASSMIFNFESAFALIPAVSIFLLLYNVKIRGNIIRNIIKIISLNSLGIYLFTSIYDNLFYKLFNALTPTTMTMIKSIVIILPTVFICSLISSILLNKIIDIFTRIINKIIEKHNLRYKNEIAY